MLLKLRRSSFDLLICSVLPSYLLLVTVLGFVACGGGSSGTQQSSPPPPSPDFQFIRRTNECFTSAGRIVILKIYFRYRH